MAQRRVVVPKIGEVIVSKRRGNRNFRLSVNNFGKVRVSIPYWIPYNAAILIINQNLDWLTDKLAKTTEISPKKEQDLKKRALQYLPLRVDEISSVYNLPYRNIRIKKMISRWGSCSTKGDISLSYYLIQLNQELIDYVILHELAHTIFPNHSRAFWAFIEDKMPNLKRLRREIRLYKPRLIINSR
jgi:predicted metal-dependent hydrolase